MIIYHTCRYSMKSSLLTETFKATLFGCLKIFIGSCQDGVVRKLMVVFWVLSLTDFLDGMMHMQN